MKKNGIIYIIRNTVNDKVYIGQTIQSLPYRIKGYEDEIKVSSRNRYIIRAMRKHGFNNFYFEILEEGLYTPEELTALEEKYMEKYKSYNNVHGYNLKRASTHGGHSEETKRKIGEAQIGELNHMFGRVGKDNPMSKKVIEITTGLEFDSITQASQYFNVSLSHAASVARGERGSTGDRVFRYFNEDGSIYFHSGFAMIKKIKTRESILEEYKKFAFI